MQPKQGLDAQIVRQYYQVSTLAQNVENLPSDPDKIWDALGAMARMNISNHKLQFNF